MTMTIKTLIALGLPCITLAAGAASTGANPALQALFDQANYWHQKAHDELARDALNKVLMVDGNNVQALYLMALWAQQSGDKSTASAFRATTPPPDAKAWRR